MSCRKENCLNDIYHNMGNRIRQVREEKHYTRERLSEEANISTKFLYEIEMGIKGFSVSTLCRIADALDISVEYLIYGEKKKGLGEELKNDIINCIKNFGEEQQEKLNHIIYLVEKSK